MNLSEYNLGAEGVANAVSCKIRKPTQREIGMLREVAAFLAGVCLVHNSYGNVQKVTALEHIANYLDSHEQQPRDTQ